MLGVVLGTLTRCTAAREVTLVSPPPAGPAGQAQTGMVEYPHPYASEFAGGSSKLAFIVPFPLSLFSTF